MSIQNKTLIEEWKSSFSRDGGAGDALGARASPDYESNYVPLYSCPLEGRYPCALAKKYGSGVAN